MQVIFDLELNIMAVRVNYEHMLLKAIRDFDPFQGKPALKLAEVTR